MTPVAIPPWNASGVIPPVNSISPVTPDRSPYAVSLAALVLRFGTSADRRRVLDGFLRYRSRLHFAGLVDGFQWLDGSFLEHIEMLEGRPPNDLDVVTFFRLPPGTDGATIMGRAPDAFPMTGAARAVLKSTFFVDPYLVHLDLPPEALVANGTYWYSLWSHRRDWSWKGYLQIDLGPTEDAIAAGHLGMAPGVGGTP
jgi:hypothetical protein